MGFSNFKLAGKRPFKALSKRDERKIFNAALHNRHWNYSDTSLDEHVTNVLQNLADAQVLNNQNTEIWEVEIWYEGMKFFERHTNDFCRGQRAFIMRHQDVNYIFVENSVADVINRVTHWRFK